MSAGGNPVDDACIEENEDSPQFYSPSPSQPACIEENKGFAEEGFAEEEFAEEGPSQKDDEEVFAEEVSLSPPQQQQEIASSMSPQLSSGEIHASMSAGGNPVDDGNEGGDTGAIHASMSAGGNPVDDGNEGGDTSNVLFTFFPECVGFCSVLCLKILLLEKCPVISFWQELQINMTSNFLLAGTTFF
ncbi:hypothetical protein ACFE04_002763 [Oxalis oulophora]